MTTIAPGPGAYTDPRVMTAKMPGFAPFATSSRRKSIITDARRDLPAPGSYELELPGTSIATAASAFKSKVHRFDESTDTLAHGPGPATYVLPSTLNAVLQPVKRTLRSQTASAAMLQKLNDLSIVGTVPSIPRREQSFGYEPTGNGKLQLQDPAITGYKGIKDDRVGPADYNPDRNYITGKNNSRSAIFPNSPRQPVAEDPKRKSFAPGPGTYNQPSIFDAAMGGSSNYKQDYVVRLNEVKSRQTSSFESKTIRDSLGDEIKRRFAPGPQQYTVPSTFKAETKPIKNQFFLSSSQRFQNPVLMANRIYTAPGDYNPLTSDFDKLQLKVMKHKKMASRSLWASQVAFEGTERRFNEVNSGISKDRIGNRCPAPGAYDPKNVFAEQVSKINPNAVTGPFGSQDTRFRRPRDWRSDSMGKPRKGSVESATLALSLVDDGQAPTHVYNNSSSSSPGKVKFLPEKDRDLSMLRGNIVRGGTAPLRGGSSSSVFGGSGTGSGSGSGVTFPKTKGRFRRDPDDVGPPPTAYHCDVKWSTGSVSMAPVVVQSRKKPDMPLPGPGDYSAANFTFAHNINKEAKKNRKDVMGGTALRDPLVPRYMLEGPGPGAHNTSGAMIKPSHNVYLSGHAV